MVDLATIKGLHPELAKCPCWYYFHENQFAYPRSEHQISSIEAGMVQIYGALAADRVLFNSDWNRRSFLDGVGQLMAQLPDRVPIGLVERLARRSSILPVPVEGIASARERLRNLIVWNHRWEYDKAPEDFAEAILNLSARGLEFRLALLGPRGARPHPALERLRAELPDRILADGQIDRAKYKSVIGQAGIVVSTARHEFQGLSVLEAASAGARPLVPDALCYPEQYPVLYRYPAGDIMALTERLADWLEQGLPPRVDLGNWLAPQTGALWQAQLGEALDQQPMRSG